MKYLWSVLLAVVALAAPVSAQTPDTSVRHAELAATRQIEIGAGGGATFTGGGTAVATLGARVNISSRFALDTSAAFYLGSYLNTLRYTGPRYGYEGQFSSATEGLYSLLIHQTLQARGRVTPFVTYGGTGSFEFRRVNEQRYSYLSGDTVVYPSYQSRDVTGLIAFDVGGGVRMPLGSHLFFEAGGRALVTPGGGAIFTAAVMVPVGGRLTP